jgi:hypothetical protein
MSEPLLEPQLREAGSLKTVIFKEDETPCLQHCVTLSSQAVNHWTGVEYMETLKSHPVQSLCTSGHVLGQLRMS